MRVLEGKSVFSGIAIGKISILQKADTSVKRTRVEDPEAEMSGHLLCRMADYDR